MKLFSIINKLSSIGVNDQLEFLDATKVRTLNQQALIATMMCLYFAIFAIGQSDFFIPMIGLATTLLIIYLNYIHRWKSAAFYWSFFYPFIVVMCSYFYGEGLGMDYVFTHCLLSVLFFLNNSRLKYFAIFLIIAAYLLSHYIMANTVPPYAHELFWYDKMILFGVSIICTSNIIIALLKGFNRYYRDSINKQKTLETLNHDLNEKAISLEQINVHLQRQAHLASHDLKTPLRSISGFTSLLKKEFFNQNGSIDESKLEEYHQHVQEGVSTMNQIIEEYMENSIEGVKKG